MVLVQPAIVIFAVCLVAAIITKALKEKYIDKEKMKSNKALMKERQAEIKKLMEEGKNEEAQELQSVMFKESMQQMGDMKTMFLIGIPYLALVYIFRYLIYPDILFESLVPLPKFNLWFIIPVPTLELSIMTGAIKAFSFYYLFWVIVIGAIWMVYEKKVKKNG